MRQGPLLDGLQVLWIGGADSRAAAAAALALGGGGLSGDVLSVKGGKLSRPAASGVTTVRGAWESRLPRLLPAAAGLLLALLALASLALSLRRRQGGPRAFSRLAVLVVLAWCFLATVAEVMVSDGVAAVLVPLAVLIVGGLSLRGSGRQGLAAAALAAAGLECVQVLLTGPPVALTLGLAGGDAATRLTAQTTLGEAVATLFGMALVLVTPGIATLARRSRRRGADLADRTVLGRRRLT
jgi:hypothetical protein